MLKKLQITGYFELSVRIRTQFELFLWIVASFDLNFELDSDLLWIKKWSHIQCPFMFNHLLSNLILSQFIWCTVSTLLTNIQLLSINKCLLFQLFWHEIKANFNNIYLFVCLFICSVCRAFSCHTPYLGQPTVCFLYNQLAKLSGSLNGFAST